MNPARQREIGAATNQPEQSDKHLPAPTLWPIGFAVGIACLLVGLVVSWVAAAAGVVIAALFGFLWVRDLRVGGRALGAGEAAPPVPARRAGEGMPEPAPGERFPRSKFLEGATLGLGAVVGGVVAVPAIGLAVAPALRKTGADEIDLGPLSDFPEGKFFVVTFVGDPEAGDVSRRTIYVRNNGLLDGQPSFTIIWNRCTHLGCPSQPSGPIDEATRKAVTNEEGVELLIKTQTQPAGFACPCHGSAWDTEGNRTAGPAVRALDRYRYSIKDGRVLLGRAYSVSEVEGEGKDAKIRRYPLKAPGLHVDGPEAWLWPIPEIRV